VIYVLIAVGMVAFTVAFLLLCVHSAVDDPDPAYSRLDRMDGLR
jgi:hypothetical protein